MLEEIKKLLRKVWNWIKKIFPKVINFLSNIVGFFRSPERLEKLKEDKNNLAISIKEKLDNGNYNVINCIFNTKTHELVDYEKTTISMEAQELDSETIKAFGDKEMIVLR